MTATREEALPTTPIAIAPDRARPLRPALRIAIVPPPAAPTVPMRRVAPAADPPAAPRRFRPELQGLRALAVGLVVVYHVWVGRVSGGVDVFLVLSGFLLVEGFARRADAGGGGGLGVVTYWRRTAGRILPPAMVVLAGTVAASVLLLPETRWAQSVREVVASALFVQNWRLAADAVDYYAAKNAASVVQHFWSLSIQGQFYLLFPLVVAAVVLGARRAGIPPRRALVGALALLSAVSLAYSVHVTLVAQRVAYFDAAARLWEFTLGGLLALTIDRVVLPVALRAVLGWVGVAGLVACGALLDVAGGFPGYLALWPVVCAGLVLLAGRTTAFGADRLLASRPARYLGDLSFGLYLWHWPVLVLTLVTLRRAEPGPLAGAAVIVIALVLAVLSRHLVEVPLRHRRDRRHSPARGRHSGRDTRPVRWPDHRLAVVGLVAVLAIAGGWQALTAARSGPVLAAADADHPGALAAAPGFVYRGAPSAPLLPSPVALVDDWSQHIGPCVFGPGTPTPEVCTAPAPAAPARRIAVVGDSHSQQLIPALLPTARERGWAVTSMLKGACPFALGPGVEPTCRRWNEDVLARLTMSHPDVVVVAASQDVRPGLRESTPPSYTTAWRALAERGIRVLAVRDNPRFDRAPALCLAGEYGPGVDCSPPRRDVLPAVPSYARAPGVPPGTAFLDLGDLYCPGETCPPAVGNVLVYIDDNHVTATYARTMASEVARRMDRALGW